MTRHRTTTAALAVPIVLAAVVIVLPTSAALGANTSAQLEARPEHSANSLEHHLEGLWAAGCLTGAARPMGSSTAEEHRLAMCAALP
jgi:hypothetical protein